MSKKTKVTLLSKTEYPLETIYCEWLQSRTQDPVPTTEEVHLRSMASLEYRTKVEEVFTKVVAMKMPLGETIDFVFLVENCPIALREQMVRHRIGHKFGERLGADIIPDLAGNSSFWCLAPDTKIPLLSGETVEIKDLAGRDEFWVYSRDENGKHAPGRGHSARITGRDVSTVVVRVESKNLPTGFAEVVCTPEHLWLKRDGTYIRADEIQPGHSLMPLYRQMWKSQPQINDGRGWVNTSRVMAGNREQHADDHAHHKNKNQLDNRPENLEWLAPTEHHALHRETYAESMRKIRANPEIEARRAAGTLRTLAGGMHSPAIRAIVMAKIKTNGMHSPEARAKVIATKKRKKMELLARYGQTPANNHKVISVTPGPVLAEVWDFEVDKHHNFALDAGIYVHNSQTTRIVDMSTFATEGDYYTPPWIEENGMKPMPGCQTTRPAVEGAASSGEIRSVTIGEWYYKQMLWCQASYRRMIAAGVPLEDARAILPVAMQHRLTWKCNLSSLMHVLSRRGCWLAQLGMWEPVITDIVNELATKVHHSFRRLIDPPCINSAGNFDKCAFGRENEEIVMKKNGEYPPCSLWVNRDATKMIAGPLVTEKQSARYEQMAKKYTKLWGRNPITGERLVLG